MEVFSELSFFIYGGLLGVFFWIGRDKMLILISRMYLNWVATIFFSFIVFTFVMIFVNLYLQQRDTRVAKTAYALELLHQQDIIDQREGNR